MQTKIHIILLILLAYFSITSLTTVKAETEETRTVYLSATEYDYPPFSVTDSGEADGFSVDLLKAVAEEMGIVVTFKIDLWSTLKEELRTGELDILPLVGYTPERDEIYDFTVPYIVMRGNIFVRSGETAITSQDDLFGKDILVLDGDNSQEWAWSIGLDSELTATATYTEAFNLLSSGQYDAVLAQGLVGEKIISDEGIDNIEPVYVYDNAGVTRLKLNLDGYEQKFCFAVVEGDAELLSILNEGLLIVSANGTYDELFQKWFPFLIEKEEVSFVDILQYVGLILLPIMVVLVTGYVITVRRSVRRQTEQIKKDYLTNEIIVEAFKKDFSTTDAKYDYVLEELLLISSSATGLIFTIDKVNHIDIKTCESKLRGEKCNHIELVDVINKSGMLEDMLNASDPVIINNYSVERPNENMVMCHQKVERLMILTSKNENLTNVVMLANKKDNYIKNNINQTSILMTGLWNMIEKKEKSEEVVYISFHDALTGLYNRRFFEEEMKRIDNPRNYPITIAFGDVNELKEINDTLGHHQGDEVLVSIANIMSKHSRANDIVARWGGDEFVIIMPNTSFENSKNLIDRVQKDTAKIDHSYGKTSIAFGLCTKTSKEEVLTLVFRKAEEQMYKNKGNSLEKLNNVNLLYGEL